MNLITYQASHFNERLRVDSRFQLYSSIYTLFDDQNIGLNDRTRRIIFPIKTYVPDNFLVPTYKGISLSFKECCASRVKEIIHKHTQENLPIKLMYSGGIDSTAVLCAFIDYLGLEQASKKITIIMSKESIDENPVMWYNFIRPYFTVENSSFSYNENDIGNWCYLTGELNDQLFGSDIQQDVSNWGGNSFLNNELSQGLIVDYLEKGRNLSRVEAEVWASVFVDNLKSCPNHGNKVWDLFWWYNFTWKWIYVYYRIFLFSNIKNLNKHWVDNSYFPFFDTPEFQLWSIHNNEEKHLGSWETYKYTAKKYICSVMKNNDYMQKTKKQSLRNILFLRPRNRCLDENYNIHMNSMIDFESVINNDHTVLEYATKLGI